MSFLSKLPKKTKVLSIIAAVMVVIAAGVMVYAYSKGTFSSKASNSSIYVRIVPNDDITKITLNKSQLKTNLHGIRKGSQDEDTKESTNQDFLGDVFYIDFYSNGYVYTLTPQIAYSNGHCYNFDPVAVQFTKYNLPYNNTVEFKVFHVPTITITPDEPGSYSATLLKGRVGYASFYANSDTMRFECVPNGDYIVQVYSTVENTRGEDSRIWKLSEYIIYDNKNDLYLKFRQLSPITGVIYQGELRN